MHRPASPSSIPDPTAAGSASVGPSVDSEITWLMHRAAQRMRSATGEQAEKYGIQLRDYIVLSALDKKVASACDSAEAAALSIFSQDDVQTFRRMLFEIIGNSEDRGSCL
ncbi:MAG: hypothetical protein ACRDOI_07290 [Trebonia sp.]